ncbi:putative mitochondrial protein, conserved [Podospora australis]|uniref:Succinate dehydrogenase assembly factor 4, mitochondrial n=1 Tax=Podospora australis TaxID=1536484 RepID=A0AAN7ACA8_9PEZI|nr:putative mitochondrial protein, conserved [Podospora australis]
MSRLTPRALLSTTTSLSSTLLPLTTILPRYSRLSSSFQSSPSPPRLPAEQQAEFERLQRAAEAALSSHTQISSDKQQPLSTPRHVTKPAEPAPAPVKETEETATQTFSGGIRKGAPPEFEGEQNPKTGEVGGPKNEPLRWGGEGDWSYNGRVTDF